MTGAEFAELRKRMFLSQTNLGIELGVTLRTVQNIEAKDEVDLLYELAIERVLLRLAAMAGLANILPKSVMNDAIAVVRDEVADEDFRALLLKQLQRE